MAKIFLLFWLPLFFAGCVTTHEGDGIPPPSLAEEDAKKLLPPEVQDRVGWTQDIYAALNAIDKPPTAERFCAIVAVIEQESKFQANPVVGNLPKIVRDGLLKKLDSLGPLAKPALALLLAGRVPGTKESFAKRIDGLRTERDLDHFFRDLAETYRDRMPGPYAITSALTRIFGNGYLQELNPVTTLGSMQVKLSFARTLDGVDDMTDDEAREYLYSRAGGVRAGVARLLNYSAAYDDVLFRFADYNAGVFSSRNAAFQEMLQELSGKKLALDGDLLAYDSKGAPTRSETKSLHAMRDFGRKENLWDWSVNRAADKEKERDFEDSSIWEEVRSAWAAKTGKKPFYARLPDVELISPKLTHPRSTGWFAKSVKRRYEACRARQ